MLEPAYLAGVFDSDGSFTIAKPKSGWRTYLNISWLSTPKTRELLEELKGQFGGSVFEFDNTGGFNPQRYIRYSVHSKRALPLIEAMLPFLRLKRRQAELCRELALDQVKGQHIRDPERRAAMLLEMRTLNRKGVEPRVSMARIARG